MACNKTRDGEAGGSREKGGATIARNESGLMLREICN